MRMADIIREKLTMALHPDLLEVVDESHKHEGHSGWREGGETHFHIHVRAAALDGLSRVQRQRRIHQILQDELRTQIHALSMRLEGDEDQ